MQPFVILPASGSEPADEWVRIGTEQHMSNQVEKAMHHYHQALRTDPLNYVATQNLAIALVQANQLGEGLMAIERATLLNPASHTAWANWALMALEAERLDEARVAAERAFAVKETGETRLPLAMVHTASGDAETAVPLYDAVLTEQPTNFMAGFNSCFARTLTDCPPVDALAARSRWYETNHFTGDKAPHTNDRDPDRPLRIGYVSGDYKRHSAAFIFMAVVLRHTKDQFTPYCYSSLPVNVAEDPMSKRFSTETQWRDISMMPDDAQVDALIRQDQIDILVDLSGHTGGNRLPIFTRKPAPIQIHAWGFAHGSGIPEIDYFFGDPVAIPLEERQHYAEQIWDLPCIVAYETPDEYDLRATSGPPVLRQAEGLFTFGCFSRFEKLSDAYLAAVAQILERVPESRMLFKDRALRRPSSLRRLRAALPGIDPRRIVPVLDSSHPDHLLAYQQADLILDPFPHTGGVAGMEQLYMGVPIVTRYGLQPGHRTTASVLTAMNSGRTGWIAKSAEEYVDLAVELQKDRQGLALARQTLRKELMASPLCDGSYVGSVEAAYRAMWRRWVSSARPS
jgi:predicted O-linked N-acetylglucosamine transferase (SPINDLY family)